jgi:hypothetical protein
MCSSPQVMAPFFEAFCPFRDCSLGGPMNPLKRGATQKGLMKVGSSDREDFRRRDYAYL